MVVLPVLTVNKPSACLALPRHLRRCHVSGLQTCTGVSAYPSDQAPPVMSGSEALARGMKRLERAEQ